MRTADEIAKVTLLLFLLDIVAKDHEHPSNTRTKELVRAELAGLGITIPYGSRYTTVAVDVLSWLNKEIPQGDP